MISRFFVNRPIFAWVIAIVIMLSGIISIFKTPVEQYPDIAPTAIQISVTYPGADAETLQNTVTQVIEQKMSGLNGLMYMSSSSDATGTLQITLSFENEIDPDIAQVQVQNKLQLAVPSLPEEVQQQGLMVKKSSSIPFIVPGFVDESGRMTVDEIADYVASYIQDPISRVKGVGDTVLYGSQFAMRIWIDATKLNAYQLTPVDVIDMLKTQNTQIAAGQVGGLPSLPTQKISASMIAQTRLTTPQEFGSIILKVNSDGSQVRLRDVARIERGSESYDIRVKINGQPGAGLGITLAGGANALDTANDIRNKLSELQRFFPAGLKVVYPYDTTPFVKVSINDVVKTLVEAIILVFLVMLIFLQNIRSTLIPTLAVPVVLLGTFAITHFLGYSINTLTMFGAILAIGLLVDDAIVVVENVERVMLEDNLSPREATFKSMQQIQGALIGIALVLSAVFVPLVFISGSSGIIYRQFSVTIVSAMVLSVIVALTLTPALCSTLLKPNHSNNRAIFLWFNRVFEQSTHHYVQVVGFMLRKSGRFLVVYGLILVGLIVIFLKLPTSFIPDEDQGILGTQANLPAGATQARTEAVLDKITNYYMTTESKNVEFVMTLSGFGFAGRGQNQGFTFIGLKDWKLRNGKENKVNAVVERATRNLSAIKEAQIIPFNFPAIIALGSASGFDFQLIDQAGLGHEKLMSARDQLLASAGKRPDILTAVRPNGMEDTPEVKITIDQEKASALGISLSDINTTLSTAWGGSYVNDFIDRGRVKKVFLMSDAHYRMMPDDIRNWYVRASNGKMVPFTSFSSTQWVYGSPRLERYNGLPSVEILGMPAQGKSSGDAMKLMEDLAQQLPDGIGYDWTGISFQEKAAGKQAPALFSISLIVVFLCLAALYESWSVPVSVILVVPLGIFGALIAVTLRGLENNVYFIVGLLTTIGLSAKNAILIVEFAKDKTEAEGLGLFEATLEAARMRLRPILMTSLAFILGVLPLALSSGAGSGAQNAVGTGVMGGMIGATLLAIFFVPVFFVIVRKRFGTASRP